MISKSFYRNVRNFTERGQKRVRVCHAAVAKVAGVVGVVGTREQSVETEELPVGRDWCSGVVDC